MNIIFALIIILKRSLVKRSCLLLGGIILLMNASISHAAIISYSTAWVIDNSNFNTIDISVGDEFVVNFIINDSVVDSDMANSVNGLFANALSNLTIKRRVSNIGLWDPAGGFFSSIDLSTSDSQSGADGITINATSGTGFPALGTSAFRAAGISLNGMNFLNDIGSGQTFAEITGSTLDQLSFNFTEFSILSDDSSFSLGSLSNIQVVPVPAAIWFLGTGLLGLLSISRWGNNNFRAS